MRLTSVLLALTALPLLNGCEPEGDAPTDLSDIDARLEALESADVAQREESAAANAALETRIATLEADAAETNTYVAEVEARVLTLEAEVAALGGGVDLTELDAAVADHDARLASVEGAGYATEIWVTSQGYGYAGDVAALDTRLTTAESDVATTSSSLSTLSASVSALTTTLGAEIAALAARLTTAEGDISGLESAIASVEGAGYATEDWVTSQGYGYDVDVAALDTRLTTAEGDISGLESELADGGVWDSSLEALFTYLTVDDTSDTLTFSGANLYVNNGAGATASTNGYGNLVIGYNEDIYGPSARTGSHNLVVGPEHSWTSYGGLIAGYNNTVTGAYSSVTGGNYNTASGEYSSVSGGYTNTASGYFSSVSGGNARTASSSYSYP
jgi:hypothetical protein